MYVKNAMTSNPYTVTPETTVVEALTIMREKKIRRLPVISKGKLEGIVTKRKLLEISPSPATSLSVFEMNYLLAKTLVREVMTKKPVTVAPNMLLEEAAKIMIDNNIGGLPVMEKDKLVGIVTEKDIFASFIEIMGFRDTGSRMTIEVADNKPGTLAEITALIASFDINITHVAIYRDELIFRLNTLNADPVINAIQEKGHRVKEIILNHG